ncbi:MAG: methyltransferase domain-containing protein [Alphaproteobacteria bacterium]|nr:methyltransferase domain-containing protein [Alphaproteobacteria bacterium]
MTITLFADAVAPERKNFPDSFWDRLVNALGLMGSRTRVLDLGTLDGEAARGLARFGAVAVGLDASERLFAEARRRDQAAGVKVDYALGSPERTGQPDASFDVILAAQSWPADGAAAAREAARVLKPKGLLAIAGFAWQPLPRNVVEVAEDVILRHAPGWSKGAVNKLYGQWWPAVHAAGFREFRTFFHDNDYAYTHAEFRRYVAARVAGAVSAAALTALDAELDQMLKKRFPGDYLVAPHRSFVFWSERP